MLQNDVVQALRIENADAVRQQDHRLAPGHLLQPPDHVIDRPQRPPREVLVAKFVGPHRGVGQRARGAVAIVDGSECAHPAAPQHVEFHAIDGGVEHALVGGELLQRAHARPGADDGHQVARLHLLIDELLQRAADLRHALERQPQVVNHQCDRAPHLVRTQPHRRWSGCAANRRDGRLGRYRSRGWRGRRDVGEMRDLLRLSVLENLKVVSGQIGHLFAFAVGDHGVHLDQVDGHPQHGHVRRLLCRGRL